MDNNWKVQLPCQLELAGKSLLLQLGRHLFPMIVQPDLTDGDNLLLFQQPCDLLNPFFRVFMQVFRVKADGCIDMRETPGNFCRLLGGWQVIPNADGPVNSKLRQGREQFFSVTVKNMVAIMGVGFKNPVIFGGKFFKSFNHGSSFRLI